LERRRLQAADLSAQGKTRAEVAGELGASAQTASRWREGGAAGMRTARQGKPAQLGRAELGKIRRVLEHGAAAVNLRRLLALGLARRGQTGSWPDRDWESSGLARAWHQRSRHRATNQSSHHRLNDQPVRIGKLQQAPRR
jgi:transposase